MRAALILMVLLGTAEGAPRSRFAAYLDPELVQRRPPPPEVAVELVLPCVTGSASWLESIRRRLGAVLGIRVVDAIAMRAVLDCASNNEPAESCEAGLLPLRPPPRDTVVIDARCAGPRIEEVAATIRARLRRSNRR